jgi:predicted site-specific integrase-resolvase
MLPELVTRQEFADAMRVDPKTVDRWRVAGKVTAVAVPNGRWRYLQAELDALVRGQRLTPAQLQRVRNGERP